MTDLNSQMDALLQQLAGEDARLRDDQRAAIQALLDGKRSLVVQRTGWGKSAVYWITSMLRRRQGHGPALVVSPLLALMRDQVAAAGKMGLKAETLNSANLDEWPHIEERIARDDLDVLLVSPERLNSPGFRERVMPHLADRIGLLVVDEAHCLSDWGHDFRPDYRRIKDLLARLPKSTPVLACTATANERVTSDVADTLGEGTLTLRGELTRRSLSLGVTRLDSTAERWAYVATWLRHQTGSGIVYALTKASAEGLANWLAGEGFPVASYSSSTDPEVRAQIEQDLKAGRLQAVVATSALGMGFDMPDLAFVIHLGCPSSPISYYQQVGRAGRALESAHAVLIPTESDERIWEHFASNAFPSQSQVRTLLSALESPLTLSELEAATGLRKTRLEATLKILDVDGAVERDGRTWRLTGQPWVYDQERIEGVKRARTEEAEQMRSYLRGRTCLERILRDALDDTDLNDCGRCTHCNPSAWETLLPQAHQDEISTLAQNAQTNLRNVEHIVPSRKMWPSGLQEVMGSKAPKGRINPAQEDGRALSLADDPGWSSEVTQALEDAQVGTPLSDEMVTGLLHVLRRWEWPERPSLVCPLLDGVHDDLVRDLAQRVGKAGRLPVKELLSAPEESLLPGWASSTQQAEDALQRTSVEYDPSTEVVLLVGIERGDGWLGTAAAWRLSQAGARNVLQVWLHSGA